MAAVIVLLSFSQAFADRNTRHVMEEASRREIQLISEAEAVRIGRECIGKPDAVLDDAELRNKANDGFRPVWELEFRAGRDEYDVHVDAVTGQVLKFEPDD